MLKLYCVRFYFKNGNGNAQPVNVSERNKTAAIKRARAFVATSYRESVTLDYAYEICRTPDDVLDWS